MGRASRLASDSDVDGLRSVRVSPTRQVVACFSGVPFMALAEAVLDLPGLCPAAASVAAIAMERDADQAVRRDPSAALFLAQHQTSNDEAILLAMLEGIERNRVPFVDWRRPGVERVWSASQFLAHVAESIALKVGSDSSRAFTAGLLAPLGWLGVCAVQPENVSTFLAAADQESPGWQKAAWGVDHATLTRRLVRSWRLPAELADVVGHLDWNANLVARLGADATLVRIVQTAVTAAQDAGHGLGLTVGTPLAELLTGLNLSQETLTAILERRSNALIPPFDDPRSQPLLTDVIRLTLENRQRREKAWIEQLNHDIDRLQTAFAQQIADEEQRLERQKVTALAEFAGGAGHEINNPLAVISGQAQYILKQMQWAEELLLEDSTPAAVLEAIKAKLTKPLQTIVSQSQRIHHVITDLMQFARPQPSRPGVIAVAKLIAETALAVRPLAEERRVRLICPDAAGQLALRVDAGQIRLALSALLRNGIEAAPQDGWTSVRIQREANGDLAFAVEDNGPGIAETHREHIFDPFYSGRSAGRGRGLGLSTAWRLARQHGGDVVLDRAVQGVTRFQLILPASVVIDNYVPAANGKREPVGYKLSAIG